MEPQTILIATHARRRECMFFNAEAIQLCVSTWRETDVYAPQETSFSRVRTRLTQVPYNVPGLGPHQWIEERPVRQPSISLSHNKETSR